MNEETFASARANPAAVGIQAQYDASMQEYKSLEAADDHMPERDLRVIFTRISDAIRFAANTRAALDEIVERVRGPMPTGNEAANAKGLASSGAGDIAQIHSQLDTLFNVLQSQVDAVRGLENL